MSSVDERIVEMRFDNKQFESGVKTTLNSLDKLNNGLQLEGASRGLDGVSRAMKSFSLAGVASGVDAIASRFTTLGIIGVTALQNITNSAINAGKNMVSALTIDPIKTGLSEYETKINAIQTILTNTASKGTTLADVNKALAELNTYADKTIYNFAEMTRNIGTFTAAGIDLDTATTAIKGIANLAAGSGSTSQQASTAMYQLSQALAAGTVKLQDWNSVVNAGMGGELFQNALKETARAHGVAVDDIIKKQGSFRESLQTGWITADILTETLSKFAQDQTLVDAATKVKTFTQLIDTMKEPVQSGWATSWEYIIGNKDQATEMLTAISDGFNALIGPSTDARNEMLKFWNENGGRDAILEGISNALKALGSILKPIGEAFSEAFPAMTGERLVEISKKFKDLTANFKIGDETIQNIKKTFQGLFSVLAWVKDGLVTIGGALMKFAGYGVEALGAVLGLTGSFGEYLSNLVQTVKNTVSFSDAMEAVGTSVSNAISNFKPLTMLIDLVKNAFKGMVGIVSGVIPLFSQVGTKIGEAFGSIQGSMAGGMNSTSLLDIFNTGVFAGIMVGIKKLVGVFKDLAESGGGFLSNITEILDGVKGSLESYQQNLNAGTLLKIAGAIAILAGSLVALSLVDPNRLASGLSAMGGLIGELFGSMVLFDKIAGTAGFKSMSKITFSMLGLSTAVLILTGAMSALAKLNWNEIAKGLTAVAGLSATLVASASVLSKNSGKITSSAVGLTVFAVAINVLAQAVKQLGALDMNTLGKGLLGVGVLIAEIAIFMKTANLDGMGVLKGTGILILASAINVLALAVKQFASLDSNSLIKGLGGVAVVLAELAIFSRLTGNSASMIASATGLTILGAAMKIFASVVSDFGSMSLESLAIGLGGLAASLGILAVAMKAMSSGIVGASAMMVMSAALALFTPQLLLLSKMSLSEIGTGLLTLAGVFGILGVAGVALGPLAPVLLSLTGAVALFGAGIAAIGGGILMFSAGLTALSVSGVAGAAALVTVITTITGLIPMILTQIGNGIISLANVITQGAPAIGAAITSVILSALQTLVTSIPAVVSSAMQLLTSLLNTLVEFTPKLIDAGVTLVLAILQGIAANIGQIVTTAIEIVINFINGVASMLGEVIQAGIDLIVSFVNGLADGIRNNTALMTDAIWNLFSAMIEAAITVLTSSISGILEIGGDIINSLSEGISGAASTVWEAAKEVATKALDGIKEKLSDFMDVGKNIVEGVVKGIGNGASSIAEAAKSAASSALTAAKNFLGIASPSKAFMEVGRWSDEGFAKGLTKFAGVVENAANGVGDTALSTLQGSLQNMAFDDINTQPTIRPVVDLSEVIDGSNQINSLFGNGQTLSLAASADTSFFRGMSIQNGNNDVVKAVKDLKNVISKASGDTYNINGVTYDDGSNVSNAVQALVRAARIERRT